PIEANKQVARLTLLCWVSGSRHSAIRAERTGSLMPSNNLLLESKRPSPVMNAGSANSSQVPGCCDSADLTSSIACIRKSESKLLELSLSISDVRPASAAWEMPYLSAS